MNSIVKINSNEGGNFSASNNRISFDIPEGKQLDLSSAFVNLVMSCPVTAEEDTAAGLGVYIPNVQLTYSSGANTDTLFSNNALIRTAKISSAMAGNIETIQRCDILTEVLGRHAKTQTQDRSQFYQQLVQPYNVSRMKGSIFCELHKEGGVRSRNVTRQPVRVKLGDLMNFCNTTQYNTSKYGKTRVELEVNLDRIAAPTQVLGAGAANVDWIGTNAAGAGGGAQNYGRFMNAQAGNGGVFGTPVSTDLTTFYVSQDSGGTAIGNNCVPRVFNRLEDSPYYVGQKLKITGTYVQNTDPQARTTDLEVIRRIASIAYNRGDGATGGGGVNAAGTIAITLNAAVEGSGPLTADSAYRNLVVRGATCTFGSGVICEYAELVLEEIAPQNLQPEPPSLQYITYKTEEIDCGNVVNFQHNFMAEPNAMTMFITQPTNNTARFIGSAQNGVDSYRLRVNNKDTSSRQIVLRDSGGNVRSAFNDPLHLIKQTNALTNSGVRKMKNYAELAIDIETNTGLESAKYVGSEFLIGQVLPLTNSPKNIQVNIECRAGTNLQNLCVFRELMAEV
tara:strand:+ start:4781 stop:6469 length:1689 start_codon:yes stop_codon:yes gene_type:complete